MPTLPVADDPFEVRGCSELARIYFAVHLTPVGGLFIWYAPMYGSGGYMLPYVDGEVEVYVHC